MDALSEALRAVRAAAAIFFRVECRAPWGFHVPPVGEVAHLLAPGVQRLISYHLVTEGRALVRMEGAEDVWVEAGEVVVMSDGAAHTVSDGETATFTASSSGLRQVLSGRPATLQVGGGGARTIIVCGFIGCDRSANRLFLDGLPPVVKVGLGGPPRDDWIGAVVQYLASEAESTSPGAAILLAKMAEALFVEALRRFVQQLPSEHVGWLAAARDPLVGAALGLLHRSPGNSWTLEGLAREVGASRAVLAKRFSHLLGKTPQGYLREWRLQLAAGMLRTRSDSVLRIASEVGYESESSFNRAFKIEFGMPPGQYRKQVKRGGDVLLGK